MCTYSGRITWTRSIEAKMNEVIELVRTKDFFTEEKQLIIQRTIKFYNSLSKDLTLYELQQYKAWFDTVHYVFDLLHQPVIRRNAEINRLEVNFDIAILNTIEEGKKMVKLQLGMCSCVSILNILTVRFLHISKFHVVKFWSITLAKNYDFYFDRYATSWRSAGQI